MKAGKAVSSNTRAMAFYHENGLVPSFKQAERFAGKNGHIGTMLDVVDARIATGINDHPWNTYYTTLTAEYFGYSRGGNRILIVAHGVGPMSTLYGIQKAYSHEYKDKSRNNRGGRITDQEFWDLEGGKYGEVCIVEFDPIVNRYQYPFMGYLTLGEAVVEPLLIARLGPRANEYLIHHANMAITIHKDEHGKSISDPYIIEMGAASNCFYVVGGFADHPLQYPFLDKGDGPVAHLLSTGRLGNVSHERERRVPHSIANEVGCHEWWNGVRLIGIQGSGRISNIHPGMNNISLAIHRFWKKLMRPINAPVFPNGFYALMETADGIWFTQYPKRGEGLDTHEPEFHVTSMTSVGDQTVFETTIGGYHGFFKYGINEVRQIAPKEANAYKIVGEPWIVSRDGNPTHHRANVQFYHIEIDATQRLMRAEQLREDFDLMMELVDTKSQPS